MGMLWFAGVDGSTTITDANTSDILRPHALASFLAGFYYRFMRMGQKAGALIIDDIYHSSYLPESLVKLGEANHITSLFISPVVGNDQIKGILILGAKTREQFQAIDQDLLALLTELALRINSGSAGSVLHREKSEKIDSLGLIIGKSAPIREIYQTILKISDSDANVFIYGESGTGKEVIARTIHGQSRRKDQAFIPVDCVALPETLLESELFGYDKGAFTGANSGKCGLLEYADKGTFFLDEITEMNVDLQAKLLRVLQERQFRRLGGQKLHDIDIRIISATNREPKEAIADGKLREDLFYRLNVIPIYVPPLRERKADIPLLIAHFMKEFSKSNEVRHLEFSDDAMQYLINYKWPGNVRELRNLVERLIALAKSEIISVEDLPVEVVKYSLFSKAENQNKPIQTLPYNQAKKKNLVEFERMYFSQLLDICGGNITKVAREAQVSRKTIYNILKKHNFNGFHMREPADVFARVMRE